ncbi:MAG: DUF3078 domain-containing protein [Flavobacteriales bacterium]
MRSKKLISVLGIAFLTLLSTPTRAQQGPEDPDTLWRSGGIINLNIAQVGLKNWTAGGQNSISLTGTGSFFTHFRKGRTSWKNDLTMAYGLLSQKKDPFIKNDDEIELFSQLSRKIDKDLFYSGRIDFRSQFAPGYAFPEADSLLRSNFLSPGYSKGSIGFRYAPEENLEVTLSPLASKMTVVKAQKLAERGAYGVDPGRNLRYEFGGNLSASVNKAILPNTRLKSEIGLFSNYLEEPGNIDVNFSLLLNMKVNSFLTASISTDMIYDDDIMIPVDSDENGIPDKRGPRLQLKEVVNVGIYFDLGKANE